MNIKNIIKKSLFFFVLTLISLSVNAQYFPYGMNYQAIARDIKGLPIVEAEIVLEISILKGDAEEIVWQETHIGTTDRFGLLNVVIGEGFSTLMGSSPDFKSIDWFSDKHSVKVRADFGDEDFVNGMIDLGTTSLQSVPYALVAERANEAPLPNLSDVVGADETKMNVNDGLAWNGINWEAGPFFLTTDGQTDLTGDWTVLNNNISLTNGTLSANALKTNAGATINEFSIDGTLGTTLPSDNIVSTEKAVKTYVDNTKGTIYTYIASEFATRWLVGTNNNLYNINKKIGIGIQNPLDKFHAEIGTDGFLVTGDYNLGTTIRSYTTKKSVMMFFPSKAAFRAGYDETGNYWQAALIGASSAAFGKNTVASGLASAAFGSKNEATNGNAFVIGYNNKALGVQSFVGGESNEASKRAAVSLGISNKSQGSASFTMGENLIAESYIETVFGRFNRAKTGSLGLNPDVYQDDDLLFVVGNGSSPTVRKNAFSILKNGNTGINTLADPSSTLEVNGSVASSIMTTNVDITLGIEHNVVLVNASASRIITLPAPSTCVGREYTIKNINAPSVEVKCITTTVNIDDQASQYISSLGFIQVISDGMQWYIIGSN